MATTSQKITADTVVIVAGQSFALGVEADVETVRQQLLGMGFADVANAEAKLGTNDAGAPTLEFVKKAGTKGLIAGDLAVRLRRVPPLPITPAKHQAAARTVARLFSEQLTFEEAVAGEAALNALRTAATALNALRTAATAPARHTAGDQLCQRLDALPAVASRAPRAW